MLRYLLFVLLFLLLTPSLGADPAGSDCPEGKSASPAPEVSAPPAQPSPSVSPQEGPAVKEPSTVKEQMGLIFDPASTFPDKPIVEEKNPARKKLLDKIFEAEKREVALKIRLDELARLQKDCDEQIQNIFKENRKLLKDLDDVIKKKEQISIFRSLAPLDKESDRIWRELGINGARREKLREQEQNWHDETLSTITKMGEATIQRFTLEEFLGRMDAAQQKEASKQDTSNAPVPARGGSRK